MKHYYKKNGLNFPLDTVWESYFLQEAAQACAIKADIEKTDKEIDNMVYQLYGFTDEEIKIVEGS